MLIYHIKLATRSLLKRKLYSILIIGGFAIGFATCILIGLYYHSEHRLNKDFANYKQIYRLYDQSEKSFNLNYELYPILAENYPEIERACPMGYLSNFEFIIKDEQLSADARIKNVISTNNNFFAIFDVKVISSLSTEPFSIKESAVITRSFAQQLYGDKNPLGHKINIHNFLNATITGVIEDLPENSTFKAKLFLNNDNEDFRLFKSCDNGICKHLTNQFLLLKENINAEQFADKLAETLKGDELSLEKPALQKLSDIYLSALPLEDMHAKGNNKLLIIFLFIAALILGLSSINYLNYIISLQYSKLKETGINKTIGAGWKQLVSYSITEVTLGILLSVLISFIIVLLLLPYSNLLFGKELSLFSSSVIEILPVFLFVIFSIIIINSIAPVILLSRFKITDFLSGIKKQGKTQVSKQVLLTFQLTASVALIGVVLIIFKQLHFIKNYDLGFNKEMLARIDLPFNNPNLKTLKQETDKLSFIKNSTLSFGCPGMINNTMGSNTGDHSFNLNCIFIGDEYLETMGIELQEGRQLLKSDYGKTCFINEEAYKQYDWENLEGKKFNNGKKGGYEVVGVAKNFHVHPLYQKVSPTALVYDTKKGSYNILSVRLIPGNIGEQIKQIRQVWNKIIPDETMNFTFYDDQFQAMYSKEEKLAASISFFSFIAIVLTCMGILGQIVLICLNRVKEIGIRKVNGAKISEVMTMLNKDFVKWVVIGFVIATPSAWYAMNKWLESFAYKTNLSWWVFALAGLLALGIALLTVSFQSWKAATKNPIESLRYE